MRISFPLVFINCTIDACCREHAAILICEFFSSARLCKIPLPSAGTGSILPWEKLGEL